MTTRAALGRLIGRPIRAAEVVDDCADEIDAIAAQLDALAALCDQWDALSRGPSPTTTAIRQAVPALTHRSPK